MNYDKRKIEHNDHDVEGEKSYREFKENEFNI
jgi:hypothetical protein